MPTQSSGSPTAESTPAATAEASSSALGPSPRNVLLVGLLGSVLMWLALPPMDVWQLAWAAPLPWLWLVRRETLCVAPATSAAKYKKLTGLGRLSPLGWWRSAGGGLPGYRELWVCGLAFWLLAVHWLRLPYPPATWAGWAALALYLAFYIPVFIGLCRIAVHRAGVSIVVAAPVVWTGLELLRAHLLSGFLMAALGHTQYRWIELIQISDLVGGYGVSFVVMLVAACLARMWPPNGNGANGRLTWWPILPATAVLAATLGYGIWRTAGDTSRPGITVALLQGAIPAEYKADPGRDEQIMDEHHRLMTGVLRGPRAREVQLIVWPETMCRVPLYDVDPEYRDPDPNGYSAQQLAEGSRDFLTGDARAAGVPLLLGLDAVHCTARGVQRFNSATLVEPNGTIQPRYDKMHRVMFGEYVPLADQLPFLYAFTPLTGGIAEGKTPRAYQIDGVRLSPSICYETVIPHLISRQMRRLSAAGEPADVLVNLTNDAWFRGSSELDMHLACDVFRAVECRLPMIVAANGGLTAVIDADGRVTAQLPRQSADALIAGVPLDSRQSLYLTIGDWPAGLCLAACCVFVVIGWRGRKGDKQTERLVGLRARGNE